MLRISSAASQASVNINKWAQEEAADYFTSAKALIWLPVTNYHHKSGSIPWIKHDRCVILKFQWTLQRSWAEATGAHTHTWSVTKDWQDDFAKKGKDSIEDKDEQEEGRYQS